MHPGCCQSALQLKQPSSMSWTPGHRGQLLQLERTAAQHLHPLDQHQLPEMTARLSGTFDAIWGYHVEIGLPWISYAM